MLNQEKTNIEILVEDVGKKNKWGIKILLLSSTITTFLTGLFAPFYILYVEKLGGDIEKAGTSLAVFSIVSGVLILAFSVWESSVKDKKKLYVGGLLLRALVFALYIYIDSYYMLLLTQFLLGISAALVNPSFDALFTEHLTKEKVIAEWGGWEGLTAIATGAASFVGPYLIIHFGFSFLFISMSLITTLIAIRLLMLPRETL
jgi:predicted MFS family arabinose efflux permease